MITINNTNIYDIPETVKMFKSSASHINNLLKKLNVKTYYINKTYINQEGIKKLENYFLMRGQNGSL